VPVEKEYSFDTEEGKNEAACPAAPGWPTTSTAL